MEKENWNSKKIICSICLTPMTQQSLSRHQRSSVCNEERKKSNKLEKKYMKAEYYNRDFIMKV